MKERKTHYQPNSHKEYLQCGAVIKRNTELTTHLDAITCRVCMFSYLAEQAPWARAFMDQLRGADVAAKRSTKTLELAHGFTPGLGGLQQMIGEFRNQHPDVVRLWSDGTLSPVAVPGGTAKPVDGKEERLGRTLGTLLSQEGGAQKAVREFLPVAAPTGRTVQPVMGDGGAPAEPVGVQPGQVAKQAGDRRQVSDKTGWDF